MAALEPNIVLFVAEINACAPSKSLRKSISMLIVFSLVSAIASVRNRTNEAASFLLIFVITVVAASNFIAVVICLPNCWETLLVSVGINLSRQITVCKDGRRRVEKVFLRLAIVAVGVLLAGHRLLALAAGYVGEIVAADDDAHSVTATPFTTRHPPLCWYPQLKQMPTRTSYVCAQKQPASRTVGSPRWKS
jgi:hypothetical protein